MFHNERVLSVVVAVIHDESHRFFVAYNDRWNQYAFPMRKPRPGEPLDKVALQSVTDHCPYPIGDATAKPLEYVGRFASSQAVGEDTFYNYHVFEVMPQQQLPEGHLGNLCGFLRYDELVGSELVSLPTKAIARALMENQEVSVGVICRHGSTGLEFLLVRNAPYKGFFFPATRRKTEADPGEVALEAVQVDTSYHGPVRLFGDRTPDVEVSQFSPRYQQQRKYRFYLRRVELPGIDLNENDNALEKSLKSNGVVWRWFSEDQLQDAETYGLSPTIEPLRRYAAQLCESA